MMEAPLYTCHSEYGSRREVFGPFSLRILCKKHINYILLYVNNTICITRMNMVYVKLIYPPSLALMPYVYDTKVRRLGENNSVT